MPFNPMDDHGYLHSLIEARHTEETMRKDPLHDFRTLSGTRPARPSLTEARSGITEHERRMMHESGVPEIDEVEGHADDLSDVKIKQKPGEEYWYVKKGAVTIGVVSKHNGKYDADTDPEGEGRYKKGFDSVKAAARYVVKHNTRTGASDKKESRELDEVFKSRKSYKKGVRHPRTGKLGSPEDEGGQTSSGNLGPPEDENDLPLRPQGGSLGEPDEEDYVPGNPYSKRKKHKYTAKAGRRTKARPDPDAKSYGHGPMRKGSVKIKEDEDEEDEYAEALSKAIKVLEVPSEAKKHKDENYAIKIPKKYADERELKALLKDRGVRPVSVSTGAHYTRATFKALKDAKKAAGATKSELEWVEDEDDLELSDDLDEVYKSPKSYMTRPPARTMAYQRKQVGPRLGEPDDEQVEDDDEDEYEDED